MKLYGSFLIRCWLIRDEHGEERTILDIEHIQQGEHLRINNPEEASRWMMKALQSGIAARAESAGSQDEEQSDEARKTEEQE